MRKPYRFLQANGLTDIINNGTGSLIITGKYPIANLLLLNINAQTTLIDYARPTLLAHSQQRHCTKPGRFSYGIQLC